MTPQYNNSVLDSNLVARRMLLSLYNPPMPVSNPVIMIRQRILVSAFVRPDGPGTAHLRPLARDAIIFLDVPVSQFASVTNNTCSIKER